MSSPRSRDYPRGTHRMYSVGLALILCAVFLASSSGVRGEEEDCADAKLDVVVVLDSSGSVGSSNFRRTKDFAAKVLEHLPLGQDAVRVGVVGYSSEAFIQSYLNQDMEKKSKLRKLSKMKYRPGFTYTNKGLKIVRENILTPNHGDRPDVKDLIILTTDGESSDQVATYEEADLLKQRKDLTILVIGIGKYTSRAEMEYMASNRSMVRYVTSFDNLATIVYDMGTISCSASKEVQSPAPTTTTTTKTTTVKTTTAKTTQTATSTTTTTPKTTTTAKTTQAPTSATTTTTPKATTTAKTTQAATFATTTTTTPKTTTTAETTQASTTAKTTQAVTPATTTTPKTTTTTITTVKTTEAATSATTTTTAKPTTGKPKITTTLTTPRNPTQRLASTVTEDCSWAKVDVIVVLSFSGSDGSKVFRRTKDGVANALQLLPVGPNAIRVGLVDCSSAMLVQSFLNEDMEKENKLKSIAAAKYGGRSEDIYKCLEATRKDVLTPGHGDRPDARDVVIFITNGKSSEQAAMYHQADLLKSRDRLMVLVIGIGNYVSVNELEYIASSPTMVRHAVSLADLSGAVSSMHSLICKEKAETSSRPSSSSDFETSGTTQTEEHSSTSEETTQPTAHSSPSHSRPGTTKSLGSTNSESTIPVEQAPEAGKNVDLGNSTASNSRQNATKVEAERYKGLTLEDVGLMLGASLGAVILLAASACCVMLCCRKKTHSMKRENEPLGKANGGFGEFYGN